MNQQLYRPDETRRYVRVYSFMETHNITFSLIRVNGIEIFCTSFAWLRTVNLTYHLRRSDHISDALACLHWLRVPERIEFKIAVLTYSIVCIIMIQTIQGAPKKVTP